MNTKAFFSSTALSLAVLAPMSAQEAVTDPVGFNTVTCLPGSDTFVGVPFARSPVFQGVVQSLQTGTGTLTITPQVSPNWTANQFQSLYMVRFTSGARAGMYYQIAANSSGDCTIDLAGDTVQISEGDIFRIHPFWTLSTLFPPETQPTFVPSASTLATARRSELLLPDVTGVGTNLAPTTKFYISGAAGSRIWRKAVTGNPTANDEIMFPDSYFIVRHGHPTITTSTQFIPVGVVELNAITTPLATRTNGQQDNFVSSGRPVPIKLKDLDLLSSGAFMASASTLANARRDILLVIDNAIVGMNKAPTTTYYYVGTYPSGSWRKAVSGNPNADDDEILPSHGLIIRKYQTATGASQLWTHTY